MTGSKLGLARPGMTSLAQHADMAEIRRFTMAAG